MVALSVVALSLVVIRRSISLPCSLGGDQTLLLCSGGDQTLLLGPWLLCGDQELGLWSLCGDQKLCP